LYTVSVLDVAGVQCVSSDPCSGTYYASGLSQGVGACPTGTACALLPETPIMGCAAEGRTDLIYVNADGTLTKDGKSVTLSGASSSTSSTTSSSSKSTASSSSKSTASSSSKSEAGSTTSSTSGSNASSGSGSTASGSDGNASSASPATFSSSGDINPGTVIAGGSDASTATDSSNSTASSAASNSSSSDSWSSESASGSYTISPGSSSANQQAEFNPGSILSDGSNASNSSSDGGLGLGSIIAIVVGCLAVVAIAAGARLLKKGKETELSTPEGAVAMEGYNNGGGGGGMTPKENVLLL
jgi:hypothetical protein